MHPAAELAPDELTFHLSVAVSVSVSVSMWISSSSSSSMILSDRLTSFSGSDNSALIAVTVSRLDQASD